MKKIILGLLFLLPSLLSLSQNKINYYEYWFDNDYSGKVSSSITPTVNYNLNANISTASLPTGLHVFNTRFLDDSVGFSQVISSFFFKTPQAAPTSTNTIDEYEYWFDNDYANKVSVSITSQQDFNLVASASTASLPVGLHVANVRFKDALGNWSQVLSQFFDKKPAAITTFNLITEYEYWFDNDYANKIGVSITPQQNFDLVASANTASLPIGLHVANIRFKDTLGNWSQVLTQFFDKKALTQSTQNLITQYEYWFDNDYANHVTQSVTPTANYQLNNSVSMASMPSGLHVYNVRFKDTNSLWSQAVSQFVYKTDAMPVTNNLITGYRYWVDNDIANATMVNLAAPIANYDLNTTINLLSAPKGARYFNIQFLDTTNKWSVVQTDSFFRTPVPFANFSSTAGNLCDSGTVSFINNSIDGDLYHWSFGDGDTSILASPAHTYTSPGSYTVTLIAKDTLMNLQDDTISVSYVTIDTLPTVIAMASMDTLCAGQSTILSGTGTAANYSWSNSVVNNQSFIPSNSQMFVLTGANGNCSAQDSIYVTVNPTPNLTLGSVLPNDTVCSGTALTMTASGATTYVWSGPQAVTNGVPFTATNSGTFTVIGSNAFGCVDTLNQLIQVNSLPMVTVGSILPNDSVCTNTMVTMSGSGATSYVWSGPQSVTNGTAFSATNSGSYAVTGTDANGCSNTATALLIVHSLPVVSVGSVSPNDTVCSGTNLTMSGAGATTYSWSGPQTVTNATAFAATITGNYVVTGADANLCTNTASQHIEVNPLPIVTVAGASPSDTLCDETFLTLSGGGALTYSWTGPQPLNNNTPFAVNLSGNYVVSGTDANGCSNSDSIYIHVKPLPIFSLGVDTSICDGETLTLSQPNVGASVLWSNNSTADTLNVNAIGTYSCLVTLDGCSFIDTLLLGIDSLPVANFGYTISNSVLSLTDSSKFGQTIKYYFGDGDSSSLVNPTHTYAANGPYVISMIVSNDCGSDTLEQSIKIITGLNEQISRNGLLVYPNPTSASLYIDLLDYDRKNIYLNILDLKGATIYKQFYEETEKVMQIDVSALSTGIYILRLKVDKKEFIHRVSIIK